jgi:hypothetical protein
VRVDRDIQQSAAEVCALQRFSGRRHRGVSKKQQAEKKGKLYKAGVELVEYSSD